MYALWSSFSKTNKKQTMFLVQQLYFLHNILPHLGEAGSSLLSAPQHQAVFVVACADTIQRLSHGLHGEKRYSLFQMAWWWVRERRDLKMSTHNTAVLLIIHFFDLQAVRLKDTRCSHRTEDNRQSSFGTVKQSCPKRCHLTRYSNFTSRYFRIVSLVSGIALWRYVLRSWSICQKGSSQRLHIKTSRALDQICTHRFDGLEKLNTVFLNVTMSIGEFDKSFAGCCLWLSHADNRKDVSECWKGILDRIK